MSDKRQTFPRKFPVAKYVFVFEQNFSRKSQTWTKARELKKIFLLLVLWKPHRFNVRHSSHLNLNLSNDCKIIAHRWASMPNTSIIKLSSLAAKKCIDIKKSETIAFSFLTRKTRLLLFEEKMIRLLKPKNGTILFL